MKLTNDRVSYTEIFYMKECTAQEAYTAAVERAATFFRTNDFELNVDVSPSYGSYRVSLSARATA